MALNGKALVAVWLNREPGDLDEFYEWHNREHMPERISLPGFRRGRRFRDIRGTPQFFVLYEAETLEALTSAAYLQVQNNPTEWTRRMAGAERGQLSRALCHVRLSLGSAQGGAVCTLRFDAERGREAELHAFLTTVAMPAIFAMPGITGVHLGVADHGASTIQTSEKIGRSPLVPNWVIVIEASLADQAVSACNQHVAFEVLVQHGAAAPVEHEAYLLELSYDGAAWPCETNNSCGPNTTCA